MPGGGEFAAGPVARVVPGGAPTGGVAAATVPGTAAPAVAGGAAGVSDQVILPKRDAVWKFPWRRIGDHAVEIALLSRIA